MTGPGGLWQRALDRSFEATCICVAVAVLLVSLALPGPLRAIISLPILLIAPGYALQLALGRRLRGADPWLTIALSLVLTAALLPLLVLLLYAVHRPLDSSSMIIVVVVATVALAVIGGVLHPDRDDAPPAASGEPPRMPVRSMATAAVIFGTLGRAGLAEWMHPPGPRGTRSKPTWRNPRVPVRTIAVCAVLALTGVIVAATWAVLPGSTPARYSSIALAGDWSKAHGVTVIPGGKRFSVAVTVANRTASTEHYEVVPTLAHTSWTRPTVTLAPGASWSGSISGSMPSGGCLHRLSVALRCQATRCNQSLVLWFSTRAKLPPSCSTLTTG